MNTRLLRFLFLLGLAGTAVTAPAQLSTNWLGSQAIPDNDGSGVAYSFTLNDPTVTAIAGITVTLDISGGFNGDLYAYVSHGDSFAVLLNRPGRTSNNPDGYFPTGMHVSLTDNATADLHLYQALGVSPAYNGNGQLIGTWAADGRDVDPDLAYDTTPRTATLDSFDGQDPNGVWTFYIRDASPGGSSTLTGWSVEVRSVPEPSVAALLGVAAIGGLVRGCRAGRFRGRK